MSRHKATKDPQPATDLEERLRDIETTLTSIGTNQYELAELLHRIARHVKHEEHRKAENIKRRIAARQARKTKSPAQRAGQANRAG